MRGNEQQINRREEDLTRLEQTTADVAEVFGDLAMIVAEQDEAIDDIEANMGKTVEQTNGAASELEAALQYQKSSRKCTLALFCVLIVVVAVVVVVVVSRN
jgi:syntaxin 1B/2/3